MKILMLGDKILIKRIDPQKVTKGGIHLPDNAKKDEQRALLGVVLEIGPGAWPDRPNYPGEDVDSGRILMEIAQGDVVLFGKFHGWDTELDGEKYHVLSYNDILSVIGDYPGVDAKFMLEEHHLRKNKL